MSRFQFWLLICVVVALLVFSAQGAIETLNPFNPNLNASIIQAWGCLLAAFGIVAVIVYFGQK